MPPAPPTPNGLSRPDLAALDSGWDDDEDDDPIDPPASVAASGPDLEALDAGWDEEEKAAAAADVAAGLDAEARRQAAEERAAARKEKLRAKKLLAKQKRKAHADAVRQSQKQKKPRRRPPTPPTTSRVAPEPRRTVGDEPSVATRALATESRTTVRRSRRSPLPFVVVAVLVAAGAAVFAWSRFFAAG